MAAIEPTVLYANGKISFCSQALPLSPLENYLLGTRKGRKSGSAA
jgi:hypothetical protein